MALWPFVAVAAVGFGLSACSGLSAPTLGPTPAREVQPTQTTEVQNPEPPPEILAKGAELYAANCQACHGDSNGVGGTGGAPPHNRAGHTWHHPDAQLREWVLNGKLGFGSPGMPALGDKLDEPEVDAILTFIKTWWTAEQRASQADISQRYQEALDKQGGQ